MDLRTPSKARHLFLAAAAALSLSGCVRPAPMPMYHTAGSQASAPVDDKDPIRIATLDEPKERTEPEEVAFYDLARSFGLKASIDLVTGRRVLRDGTNTVVIMPSTKHLEINRRRFPLEGMIRWKQGVLMVPGDASAYLAEWLNTRSVPEVAGDPDLFDGSEPGLNEASRRRARVAKRPSKARASASSLPASWQVKANRQWKSIVIHHSATDVGGAKSFHASHKKKWTNGLGYHFVIGNGTTTPDGHVEVGPRWLRQNRGIDGAHAGNKRYNKQGIGICLVGNFNSGRPTPRQLVALRRLCSSLMARYGIDARAVYQHKQVRRGHTDCPGKHFPFQTFRRSLD